MSEVQINAICTFTHHEGAKVEILATRQEIGEVYEVRVTHPDGTVDSDIFEDCSDAQEDFLETLKIFI